MKFKVLRSFDLFVFLKDKAKRRSKAGALQGALTKCLGKRDGQNLACFYIPMPQNGYRRLLSCLRRLSAVSGLSIKPLAPVDHASREYSVYAVR